MSNPFSPGDLTLSKFRFYSIAIVAQNKKLGVDVIDASPIEDLSMLDGEISANTNTTKVKGKTSSGRNYNSSLKSSVTLKAKWLPLGTSNRLTSPDVRRGEQVMLYQFGDADVYYWTTLKQDSHLRRLETVLYAFSATPNEGDTLGPDNCYFLEVSTHRKLITLHTTKANSEPYSYQVQINTGDGCIVIADDIGNEFVLNSKTDRVMMKNSSGSYVDVNRSNVIINAPTSFQVKTALFNVEASNSVIQGGLTGNGNAVISGSFASSSIKTGNLKYGSIG